jgi:GTP cyclohydrolase I
LNKKKIEHGVALILEGLIGKEWTADRNYSGTPTRVARFYEEMFRERPFTLTTFEEEHKQMICLLHHTDYTLCPHHLLPVRFDISCAYIPEKRVLGLSKLVRLIQNHFEEPILQEMLTDSLADELMHASSDVLGAAVLIYGDHACMQIRGPHSTGRAATSAMRGVFIDKPAAREEFLALARFK